MKILPVITFVVAVVVVFVFGVFSGIGGNYHTRSVGQTMEQDFDQKLETFLQYPDGRQERFQVLESGRRLAEAFRSGSVDDKMEVEDKLNRMVYEGLHYKEGQRLNELGLQFNEEDNLRYVLLTLSLYQPQSEMNKYATQVALHTAR